MAGPPTRDRAFPLRWPPISYGVPDTILQPHMHSGSRKPPKRLQLKKPPPTPGRGGFPPVNHLSHRRGGRESLGE